MRLLSRGSWEDVEDLIIDSPTCSKETFRFQTMLALLVSQSVWKSEVLDVKTAFLQGKSLCRDVIVVPPKV